MKAWVSDDCPHAVITYFLALCLTSVAHWNTHSRIWSTTVYAVPWFSSTPMESETGKSSELESVPELKGTRDSWGRFWKTPEPDVETGSTKDDSKPNTRAPWSKNVTIRRGVDNPFKKEPTLPPMSTSSPSVTLTQPPTARTRVTNKGSDTPSKFIEVFRKSDLPPIPVTEDSVSDYGLSVYYEDIPVDKNNKTFPSGIVDHDQPIPLPRLSEWIRADDALGVSIVHKMPSFSPLL
jgi:hypothetical protein